MILISRKRDTCTVDRKVEWLIFKILHFAKFLFIVCLLFASFWNPRKERIEAKSFLLEWTNEWTGIAKYTFFYLFKQCVTYPSDYYSNLCMFHKYSVIMLPLSPDYFLAKHTTPSNKPNSSACLRVTARGEQIPTAKKIRWSKKILKSWLITKLDPRTGVVLYQRKILTSTESRIPQVRYIVQMKIRGGSRRPLYIYVENSYGRINRRVEDWDGDVRGGRQKR